jgi:hypothetical protein
VLVAAHCAGIDGASGAELPHRGRLLGLHQPAPEARQPRHQRGQGRLARGESARACMRARGRGERGRPDVDRGRGQREKSKVAESPYSPTRAQRAGRRR